VSVAQVATILVASTDVLIIAKLLGPAAVVPYACTGKLCSVLANQVNILMHTAGPGLCELKAGQSRQKIYEAISALTQGVLLCSGLVFCVVMLINHWFVDWWVTAHQYGGLNLTILFLSMLVIRHWTAVTANSVFFFGHQRRISLTNLTDGVVTVVTIFAGVKIWGPAGALVGTMAGALLVSLPLNLSKIAEDAGVSTARLVSRMLGAWWWRFALAGGVATWIAAHWSPRNVFEGAATTIGSALLYALFMLPIAFRGALGIYTRPLRESLKEKFLVLRGGIRPVEAGPQS
jgi:O-antigen/teichoic acid export membrane protein